MTIKFFCPRWGAEHIAWPKFVEAVSKAGYSGIEWFPYSEKGDYVKVVELLEHHRLDFAIVMAVSERVDDFKGYLAALGKELQHLASVQTTRTRPLQISVQMGREYFTPGQVDACLLICDQVSRETGIPIYQETHRNKWSYAAHAVYPRLLQHPGLLLTLDVSHWFCVSESYLADQQHVVDLAIRHTRHVHARIGHTEGPQVWEPASEEFAEALGEHLKIWDRWVRFMKESGASQCTITPEFGPPPYLVFANRPGTPFEEQWRLNEWMKNLLETRYANL